MAFYDELGLRRVINASGTMTHLGGSISDPRVLDAMKEASQRFIIMMELIEKVSKIIAEVTGAEAGLVTAGSSAALTLSTAACIMKGSGLEDFEIQPVERLDLDGEWRGLIQRLPNSSWTKNEVIIQKTHRNPFDHAFQIAGGKLIVVGTNDECPSEDLEAAITEKTAAVAFTAIMEDRGIPLNEVVKISKRYNVPVIVDAAAELPPRSNLKRFIAHGADLVAFSGGKHIGGPNDTGILCGRQDLIKLAMLQSAPYRGMGRGMKVDRTQIVGLITALKLWLEKDEKAELEKWKVKAKWISEQLKETSGIEKVETVIEDNRRWDHVYITLNEKTPSAKEIILILRKDDPSIWMNYIAPNKIEIDTSLLKDGEEKVVLSALKNILDKYI